MDWCAPKKAHGDGGQKPLPHKRKGAEYPAAIVPPPFIPGP